MILHDEYEATLVSFKTLLDNLQRSEDKDIGDKLSLAFNRYKEITNACSVSALNAKPLSFRQRRKVPYIYVDLCMRNLKEILVAGKITRLLKKYATNRF